MALEKGYWTEAPVSPKDVVECLVQSEPLSLVTEVSSYVDLCSSERRQRYVGREPSNALVEGEKQVITSVDQLQNEVQDLQATMGRLLKAADNVASTRSRDLQDIASLLYSNPPLTTLPMASIGVNPLAQMTSKVEKLVIAQDSVRNRLEIGRDNVKAAVHAISDRGESLRLFLDLLLERMRNLPSFPLGDNNRCVELESLCDRYQRRSQYLLAMIDRVARNSKAIHDLVLLLERDRSFDDSTLLQAQPITLAEELSVWGMRRTDAIALPQFGLLHGAMQIVSFGLCGVDRIPSFTQPQFLRVVSLLVLFVVFNITLRSRFHAGGLGHTIITPQATSKSIRDLLLEGRTSISDELIHNLVPKRM